MNFLKKTNAAFTSYRFSPRVETAELTERRMHFDLNNFIIILKFVHWLVGLGPAGDDSDTNEEWSDGKKVAGVGECVSIENEF